MSHPLSWTCFALCLFGCVEEVQIIDSSEPAGGNGPISTVSIDELHTACSELCTAAPTCDLWRGFCESQCESVLVDGCEAEGLAIIQCLAGALPEVCGLSNATCGLQIEALFECAPLDTCAPGACLIELGTCSCSGLCGEHIVTQECVRVDDEHSTCTCSYGTQVKTCDTVHTSCTFDACCSGVAP